MCREMWLLSQALGFHYLLLNYTLSYKNSCAGKELYITSEFCFATSFPKWLCKIRSLRLLRKEMKCMETFGMDKINKHKNNGREYSIICYLIIYPRYFTKCIHVYCCCSVTQSCLTLCNPMDCSTPGQSLNQWTTKEFPHLYSVHKIFYLG